VWDLIRFEIQNNRTVHFLVMKEFFNKLIMHTMSNMPVDTNIFRTNLLLTDKAIISSVVVGRDINYWLQLLILTSRI
jgi:hypothetical protein